MDVIDPGIAKRRIDMVRTHMHLETIHDWDGVIATFEHPRYEIWGTGIVFEGEEEVRLFFHAWRVPFPDQHTELIAIAHTGNTVLVEYWLNGTHLGPLSLDGAIFEPTGRSFRMRMAASFEFAPGSDRIKCERPFFDLRPIAQQLGLG